MRSDWKISVRWGFDAFFVVRDASQYRTNRCRDWNCRAGVTVVDFSCHCFFSPSWGDLARLRGGSTRTNQGDDTEFSFTIPSEVKILNESTLVHYWPDKSKAATVTFVTGSMLQRIEEMCFADYRLKSICIPRNVDFIDGSAFVGCSIGSVSVDRSNKRFSIYQNFLYDTINLIAIRYFGAKRSVLLWNDLKVLGKCCFAGCCNKDNQFDAVIFARNSGLTRIDEACFRYCSLKFICIPRSVEILGKSC
jgi:hypothetical protein